MKGRLATLKPRVQSIKTPKPPVVQRIRGYTNQKRRERILAKNPLCVRCWERGYIKAAEVLDHIIPLSLGGSDTDDNLRPLCQDPCHLEVTAEQFGHKPKGFTLR